MALFGKPGVFVFNDGCMVVVVSILGVVRAGHPGEGGCDVGTGVRPDQTPIYSDSILRCPGARSWAAWEDYLLTEK